MAFGWTLVGRREQLAVIEDARTVATSRGVLIHGPAGVGKSRLADEALTAADRSGWRTGRATASAAACSTPLGALAHLLPSEVVDARADPVSLYATVACAFAARAGGRPFVLMIDDLPRLDSTSLTLVGQLLDAGVIFLIGTVRTGETGPGPDADMVRREHLVRIDLADLTETDVDTLVHFALHGPVEPATAAALWRASRGNPLILRELILGASATGRLAESHGVWGVIGPLTTPTLIEVVESRLAAVSKAGRRALEMLAVRAPIGLVDLQHVVGADVQPVGRPQRGRHRVDQLHERHDSPTEGCGADASQPLRQRAHLRLARRRQRS